MRTLSCDPHIEVVGASVRSIIENIQHDDIEPYLSKYNLRDIQSDQWYPCQDWLNCMNDLLENTDATSNMIAIGLKVAQNVVLPPQLTNATLPQILSQWDKIYQNQHRGGDVGYVRVEKVSDTHYITYHKRLYPDDMSYGVAYGFCRRFLPAGTIFTVKYDENVPRQDNGGEETVIHVSW